MFGLYPITTNSYCPNLGVTSRWSSVNDIETSGELEYLFTSTYWYTYGGNLYSPGLYANVFYYGISAPPEYNLISVGQRVAWIGGTGEDYNYYTDLLYPTYSYVGSKGFDDYENAWYVTVMSPVQLLFYNYGDLYFYQYTGAPNWTPIVAAG